MHNSYVSQEWNEVCSVQIGFYKIMNGGKRVCRDGDLVIRNVIDILCRVCQVQEA